MRAVVLAAAGLLYGTVLLAAAGVIPALRFTRERIDIAVRRESFAVDALYVYRNPWPFPVAQGLRIPFPDDADLGRPATVEVVEMGGAPDLPERPIPVYWSGGEPRFAITAAARAEATVRVRFTQRAEHGIGPLPPAHHPPLGPRARAWRVRAPSRGGAHHRQQLPALSRRRHGFRPSRLHARERLEVHVDGNPRLTARGRPWRIGPLAASALAVLGCPGAAWANNPPGPHQSLALLAFPVVIVALTSLGGGYAVYRALGQKLRNRAAVLWAAAIGLMLVSGFNEGAAALVGIGIGAWACWRGVRMLAWGARAGQGAAAAEPHLAAARRGRLLAAGGLLAIAAVALAGQTVAFLSWSPSEGRVEQELTELLAFQARRAAAFDPAAGATRFAAPRIEPDGRLSFDGFEPVSLHATRRPTGWGSVYEVRFVLGAGGDTYQVWAYPDRFPPLPYAWIYRITLPSYYADETGRLRAVRVSRKGELCPADAPVVR